MPCENCSAVIGKGVLISFLLSDKARVHGRVCVYVCASYELGCVAAGSHEQPSTCMYKLILCCLKQALFL